jgi:CubicO group peptidase (beta-lactamase class C family)
MKKQSLLLNRFPALSFYFLIITTLNVYAQQIKSGLLDYQKKVQTWLTIYKVPAVGIGIIEDGKLRQIMVFGDLIKGDPAPYNTIFQVASLTKPVTAMLTLKLVSMGEWQLDEPLSKYWVDPDVINDRRHLKLTTRHVLTHQTGFDNWRSNNKLKKLVFNFEPGTKFNYSGEGFEYLKHALEHKFNMSLDSLADSILFKPLKMYDTRYVWNEHIDESRYAVLHDISGVAIEMPRNRNASAADLLKTTIEDYCKFGVEVMKGTLLKEEVFNDMITPQSKVSEYESFGLGWDIIKDLSHGEFTLMHDGDDYGAHSIVILLPKSKRGIVVLTNGEKGDDVIKNVIIESLDLGKEIVDKFDW